MEFRKLEDHVGYVSAVEKLRELKNSFSAVQREINDIMVGLRKPADSVEAEARDFLDGKSTSQHSEAALREQLGSLQHHEQVLQTAIVLQRREAEQQRVLASAEICKACESDWRKQTKAVRDHASRLSRICEDQSRFASELERQGIFLPATWRQCLTTENLRWQLTNLVAEIG